MKSEISAAQKCMTCYDLGARLRFGIKRSFLDWSVQIYLIDSKGMEIWIDAKHSVLMKNYTLVSELLPWKD